MVNSSPRIALVTGAASGIARASARAMAEMGVTIAVADITEKAAHEAASEFTGKGHRAYVLDVSQEAQIQATFEKIESEMGPIAIVCNLAGVNGIPGGKRPTFADTSLELWSSVQSVNSTGVFLCMREMLRRRAKTPVQDGRIINMASMAAQIGGINSPTAYVASKGAVLAITKQGAAEAAPLGITVNAVAPGAIDTPLLRQVMPKEKDAAYSQKIPLGRVGTAEEVGAVIAFLASPAASYITGACFDVNGGMRMG